MEENKGTFRLTMRQGPTPGKAFDLVKDLVTIGRDVSNDIVINDAEVSRNHARLTAQAGSYQMEDLASTNGVMVNGQRLTGPKLLQPSDIVGLGETVTLEFSLYSESASTIVAFKSTPPVEAAPSPVMSAPLPTTAPLVAPLETPPLQTAPPDPYIPQPVYSSPIPEPVSEPLPHAADWEASPPSIAIPASSIPSPTPLAPAPKSQPNWALIGGIGCGCLTVMCLCMALIGVLVQFGPMISGVGGR